MEILRNHYVHRQIEEENGIRLLAILPGNFDEPVRCTLSAVSLDDEPSYEAISYTWGSVHFDKSIFCDGLILPVTKNLYEGLLRIRRRKAIRVVWVDAVCINQADVDERNTQILFMARIFKQAKQVIVWLGSISDQDDLVKLPLCPDGKWTWEPVKWTSKKQINQLPISWLQHFNRPWFLRTWILQEAVLARKTVVIHGHQKIPWSDFEHVARSFKSRDKDVGSKLTRRSNATHSFEDQYSVLNDALSLICQISDRQMQVSAGQGDQFSPYLLLETTQRLRAIDPRDKVFALLGLFPDDLRRLIRPDYTARIEDVLVELAETLISFNGDLRVLERAVPGKHESTLPSWVPDLHGIDDSWGVFGAGIDPFGRWNWQGENRFDRRTVISSIDDPAVATCDGERRLHVKGLRVARIGHLNEESTSTTTSVQHAHAAILRCVSSWYQTVRMHNTWRDDNLKRLAIFLDTLGCRAREAEDLEREDLRQSHNKIYSYAYQIKRNVFLSTTDGGTPREDPFKIVHKSRNTRVAQAIYEATKFSRNPLGQIQRTTRKILQPASILREKDDYACVPSGSANDSDSTRSNISAAKKLPDDDFSSSESVSTTSDDSDESTNLARRTYRHGRSLIRRRITKPAAKWTRFTKSQYRNAQKRLGNTTDDETVVVRNGDSDIVKAAELGPESGQHALRSPALPRQPVSDIDLLANLQPDTNVLPASGELEEALSSPSSSTDTSDLGTSDSEYSLVSSKSPSEFEYDGGGPYSLHVKQLKRHSPCTCSREQIDTSDFHFTPDEDTALFDPNDRRMLTISAQYYFFDNTRLDLLSCVPNRQFGFIDIAPGDTRMALFCLAARPGDLLCILRGIRYPCVLREVEPGQYKYIGSAFVNTIWDWDWFEKGEGQIGAGGRMGGGRDLLEDLVLI